MYEGYTMRRMKFLRALWAAALGCVCATFVHATSSDQARVIEVGISMSIPPWVIKENDSGIELDIIRGALEDKGYRIEPVYLPFERAYKLFDVGQLDVVMNAKPGITRHGFLSDPVVTFQNYAISLTKKAFPKDIGWEHLSTHSVVAFQKAKDLLGPDFKAAVARNKDYQEIAKQELQVNLLFVRELDFVVMDKSIFGYFWKQALQKNQLKAQARKRFEQEVTFHPIFPPSPYPFIFKSEQVKDDFNQGLLELKANGEYQQILDKYNHLRDLYEISGIK